MAKQVEYWRWPESRWTNPDIDWHKGKTITVGVDVGSVGSKAVVMVDGAVYAYSFMRTGSGSRDSAQRVLGWALEGTGIAQGDIKYTVGTGYGRVNVPMAQRTITEIACHALGAHFSYGPTVRTVIDVGGQDVKAIRCDEKGKVVIFLMNDKCAAGTGRGMEAFADLLKIPIQDVGERSFQIDAEPPPVSSTCVVFAKSEAVGLLRQGWSAEKVLAAYCSAMANKVMELLQRLGVTRELAVTGGQSKNVGLIRRLEKLIGFEPLRSPKYDAILAGAIGAALFARAIVEKGKG